MFIFFRLFFVVFVVFRLFRFSRQAHRSLGSSFRSGWTKRRLRWPLVAVYCKPICTVSRNPFLISRNPLRTTGYWLFRTVCMISRGPVFLWYYGTLFVLWYVGRLGRCVWHHETPCVLLGTEYMIQQYHAIPFVLRLFHSASTSFQKLHVSPARSLLVGAVRTIPSCKQASKSFAVTAGCPRHHFPYIYMHACIHSHT